METGRLIAILIFSLLVYIAVLRSIIYFAVKSAVSEMNQTLKQLTNIMDEIAKDKGIDVNQIDYNPQLYSQDKKQAVTSQEKSRLIIK